MKNFIKNTNYYSFLFSLLVISGLTLLSSCSSLEEEDRSYSKKTSLTEVHPEEVSQQTETNNPSLTTEQNQQENVNISTVNNSSSENTTSAPSTQPTEPVLQEIPTAKPVTGKPGFVISPHSPNAGYVDVRGFPPGTQVKDPYSGKVFLVP